MVRYPRERRSNLRELASERVRRAGGGEVPLSAVANLTESRQQATFMRIDGNRAATVNARADAAVITPNQAGGGWNGRSCRNCSPTTPA